MAQDQFSEFGSLEFQSWKDLRHRLRSSHLTGSGNRGSEGPADLRKSPLRSAGTDCLVFAQPVTAFCCFYLKKGIQDCFVQDWCFDDFGATGSQRWYTFISFLLPPHLQRIPDH